MLKTRDAIKKKFPKGIEKLEIGSGSNPEPGYVHLDIQSGLPDLDILANVRNTPVPSNFVSGHIRAVHIMEHFCHPQDSSAAMRKEWGTTLEVVKEMYRILKPGGKFLIVTPDFDKITASNFLGRVDKYWLQRWTVGGHRDNYDVHHWLWTHDDAKKWFHEAGFKDVKDCNPIQGWKARMRLKWRTPATRGNMEWHKIEWYHWLFIEGTK